MPSLCDLLRYSLVIYSFPRVDQQPDFDGLPRAVNLSPTALPAHPSSRSRNFYPLRCADVRLCRSLRSVCAADEWPLVSSARQATRLQFGPPSYHSLTPSPIFLLLSCSLGSFIPTREECKLPPKPPAFSHPERLLQFVWRQPSTWRLCQRVFQGLISGF